MTYRYATLLRPPEPGAVPRDGLLQCGYSENLTPSGRRSWGWAEYDHQLSTEDVAHYDLEPLFDEDNNRAGADIPRQKGINNMARISIDGGKTFCTPEQALEHVLFEQVLMKMDPSIRDKVEQLPGRKSIQDFLQLYLENADKDLII